MSVMLPMSKDIYSPAIPKFNIPEITNEDIEKYLHLQFAVYTSQIGGEKFPLVIVAHSDRLHVYNDISELKYNAFNADLYSKAVGECEMSLRKLMAGYVLYGFINTNGGMEIFHVWDFDKSVWLNVDQFEALSTKVTARITLPKIYKRCHIMSQVPSMTDLFIKNVNDPGLFFIQYTQK